ncbi:VOC family protein [Ichthyenterobacterium sp. W332]|uniref:VOC family protein n=1 Tax=Microcosmobacter mediterraneus TaxID=3075607 RepID=A0ABU2YN28_9FLAO|nr:VOC family protein [Ichthyenterobacterium sp. W332]MDT0559200.1 VOC family protein [Ichthyenterobacterium sp. W332]
MEQNMVAWFEIPVTNMDRAKAFYESVFKIDIKVEDFGGTLMGWFPSAIGKPGAMGSLVKNEAYIPSDTHGALVYFGSNDVADELSRVETSGGYVLQDKTQISPEIGFMALFKDTEGNRIALYSEPI